MVPVSTSDNPVETHQLENWDKWGKIWYGIGGGHALQDKLFGFP